MKLKRWHLLLLLALAVVVWWAALSPRDGPLTVSFLDVGQGDASLIQVAGRQVLVDGGPDPQSLALALGSRLPFWDRDIDLMVLTHPHADHLDGLLDVLRRYRVRQVLEMEPAPSFDSPAYPRWQGLLEEQRIPRRWAEAGQRIDMGGGAVLTVLNPVAGPATASDIDDSSVVLRIEKGAVSFLFTGDIGQETEARLLAAPMELSSTVLKVAHHGSDTSTSAPFLAVVRPRVAVISVGEDNKFGHPKPVVLKRLSDVQVYRTDERGSIDVTTDGQRLWVRVDR